MNTETCCKCGKTIELKIAKNLDNTRFWWYAAVGEMKDAFVCSEDGMKWEPHRVAVSA